jgi:hypothetical protein
MELSTIHADRHPSGLEILLERFAVEMRYVPPQARLVADLGELPCALQRKALACGGDAAWLAWTDESCVWFLIGRLPRWFVDRPDQVMMQALFFDTFGGLVSSGLWRREQPGRWKLCQA